MLTKVKLVNDGKIILGEDAVFSNLTDLYRGLFRVLELAVYTNEKELLQILEKWAQNGTFMTLQSSNYLVHAGIIKTHQRYVYGITGHREFGDITFVTLFSKPSQNQKIGFANTFQIKVDSTPFEAYRKIFDQANWPQLDFYRVNFLQNLALSYDPLACDFLHYFLIGWQSGCHPIMEIPLSLTWLDDTHGTYWKLLPSLLNDGCIINRFGNTGIDTSMRKLFLTTGINIEFLLPFCLPKLKSTLENILKIGVLGTKGREKPSNEDPPSNEDTDKHDQNLKYPISSSIVIATEVFVGEGEGRFEKG